MRILTCSAVIGQLLLIAALPAAAAPPVAADPQVQTDTGSDATVNRGTYTQQARSDMRDWQQKPSDLGRNAKAGGEKAGNAAGSDLNIAWKKTQQESRNLQTASAEGWAGAKLSYEKASHELADAWDRNKP